MLRHNEINLGECLLRLKTTLVINQNLASINLWIVTDGKAGDQNPCIGIANALNIPYVLKNALNSSAYNDILSYFLSPKKLLSLHGAQFIEPFPHIIIASGRKAAFIMRAIKKLSPQTFCVFLKNPYKNDSKIDFVWQPQHDTKLHLNAYTSLLSPHHLQIIPYVQSGILPGVEHKMLGVLVGGNSRHCKWSQKNCAEFIKLLNKHAQNADITLKILTSRRTPIRLQNALLELCKNSRHSCFIPNSLALNSLALNSMALNSMAPNPYVQILGEADALIVTADSVNMLSESLARGCAVYIFQPNLANGRIKNHISALIAEKLVKPFGVMLDFTAQDALNVTPALAAKIAIAYEQFNQNTGQ